MFWDQFTYTRPTRNHQGAEADLYGFEFSFSGISVKIFTVDVTSSDVKDMPKLQSISIFKIKEDGTFKPFSVDDWQKILRKAAIEESGFYISAMFNPSWEDCEKLVTVIKEEVESGKLPILIKTNKAQLAICSKCGLSDPYASPSPNHNNEIRCYRCF